MSLELEDKIKNFYKTLTKIEKIINDIFLIYVLNNLMNYCRKKDFYLIKDY